MTVSQRPAGVRALSSFLVVALAILLGAASARAQSGIDRKLAIAPDASIRIMNLAGSLRVVGWDRDTIAVTGTVDGADRLYMGGEDDSAKLGVWAEDGENPSEAHLEVRVPRRSTVWVKTESADVEVSGLSGSVDVYSVTGRIEVLGELRHLYVESIGGDLAIDGTARLLRAKTAGGSITFRGEAEDANLSSVSGDLSVIVRPLARGRFESVSGNIWFEGDVEKGGSLAFYSHDGTIELRLPKEISADFEIATIEGKIRNELDADLNGGGGANVTVTTFSGTIVLTER